MKTDSLVRKAKGKLTASFYGYLQRIIYMPKKGKLISFIKVIALAFILRLEDKKAIIGALWTKPSLLSRVAFLVGIAHNINNLGNSYATSDNNLNHTQRIEKRVVEWTKKTTRCVRSDNIEGYVTSGGTESNLFLMWSGREWLKTKNSRSCYLLVSGFTHYSISKAGRILDLQEIRTPISEETWGITGETLKTTLKSLYHKKVRNILLPITLGYSSTGSFDQLEEMIEAIQQFQKKNKDFNVFMWIDAAHQGLPLAFLDNTFCPFKDKLVQGLVLDFHKLGGTPIPSGIVLYRGHLRKNIQTPIDYLEEDDATISGSRPGFSALAIWANINANSRRRWREEFEMLSKKKQWFIHRLQRKYPSATVISTQHSLTCAIVIDREFKRLPTDVENKFSLNLAAINYLSGKSKKRKVLKHYKIHILPKTRNDLFKLFIRSIDS